MKDSKQIPNYLIQIVEVGKMGCCLINAQEFFSEKNLKEITYWKGNKCITIEKYDPNEAEAERKRKSRGSKRNS